MQDSIFGDLFSVNGMDNQMIGKNGGIETDKKKSS